MFSCGCSLTQKPTQTPLMTSMDPHVLCQMWVCSILGQVDSLCRIPQAVLCCRAIAMGGVHDLLGWLGGWTVPCGPHMNSRIQGLPAELLCSEAIVAVDNSMFWLIGVSLPSELTAVCVRPHYFTVMCVNQDAVHLISEALAGTCSFPCSFFFPVSLIPFLSVRGICCLETQLTHKHSHKVFLLLPLCAVGHFLCQKITKGESDRPRSMS